MSSKDRRAELEAELAAADDPLRRARVCQDAATELGRGSCNHGLTQFDEPPLQSCVSKPGIDLRIELVNNLRRRALRRNQSEPLTRFVARDQFTDGRNVR